MKYLIKVKGDNPYKFEFPEFGCEIEVVKDKLAKGTTVEQRASAALCEALNALRRARKPIPMPSMDGDATIPLVLELKIKLWNWMLANHYRAADISEKLGLTAHKTSRVMNFAHPSDIKRLLEVCEALGAEVSIDVH